MQPQRSFQFGRPDTARVRKTEVLLTFWSGSLILPFALPRYMGPLKSQSFGKKASLPMLLYMKLFIFKEMTLKGKTCYHRGRDKKTYKKDKQKVDNADI